ncbi:hypothetical protein BDV18DRAFT_158246 [Aspergillus unguis]
MASPFGEPPAGLDLSESRTARNNAITIALTAMATVAVGMRLFARTRVQKIRLEADDWLIVASLVPTHAILVCTIVGGRYGLGKHVWAVSMDHITRVNQTHFAYVLIYVWAIPLIKLSILFFYRRIFGTTPMMWICGFMTIGYFISCTIAFSACCRPPSYYWTQYTRPESGHCVFDLYPFYLGNASANVFTDILILILPIPLIWRLQMKPLKKAFLCAIFLLGSFVCVASFVRIASMVPLKTNLDVTWIMGDVYVWSSVEPCIGILCACLPTLQPVLRRILKRLKLSSSARNGGGPDSTPQGASSSVKRKSRAPDGGAFRHLTGKSGASSTFKRGFTSLGLRPDDEALLVTTAGHVEMDDLYEREVASEMKDGYRGDSHERHASTGSKGNGKGDGMGIQITTDVTWREEHK